MTEALRRALLPPPEEEEAAPLCGLCRGLAGAARAATVVARRRAASMPGRASGTLSWPADGCAEPRTATGLSSAARRRLQFIVRAHSFRAFSYGTELQLYALFACLLAKLGHAPQKKKGKAGIRFPLVDGAQDALDGVPCPPS